MSEPSVPTGVITGFEGLILQRGGTELGLVKLGDRFTVRSQQKEVLTLLEQALQPLATQTILALDLVEFEVTPDELEIAMQISRELEAVNYVSHVYRLRDGLSSNIYLTHELTVQFATGVDLKPLKRIFNQLGLHSPVPLAGVERAAVFQVGARSPINPLKLSNLLMRRPEIRLAEPNIAIKIQPFYSPKSTEYSQQWYLNHQGDSQENTSSEIAADAHIAIEGAWDITRGDRSVLVAIADQGFDLSHPSVQGMGKIAFPKDLAHPDCLPVEGSTAHGTLCAQIAIAEETLTGRVGVAPGCTFVPIGMGEVLDDTALERLCDWVVETDVAVLSCGWGASASCYPLSLRQRLALAKAATQGRSGKGCVIVFAAGNANRPIHGTVKEQGWPDAKLEGETFWLNGFAVHPDVMAVSACTSLNQKAAYSNWGGAIAISAPGHNAPPGLVGDGGYELTGPLLERDFLGKPIVQPSAEASLNGTSSAAAIVSGVAALVLSANPKLTAIAVRRLLQDTADKIIDLAPDPQLGICHGTYDGSGHSQWFGYGRVNAHRAVFIAHQMRSVANPVTQWIQLTGIAPLTIPDANPEGITSLIQVDETRPLQDIQVSVEIAHEYLGDLEITLISPSGASILLQGRTLARRTQLQTTYTLQTTPLLQRCVQKSPQGVWKLRVVDHVVSHTGTLTGWNLNLGL